MVFLLILWEFVIVLKIFFFVFTICSAILNPLVVSFFPERSFQHLPAPLQFRLTSTVPSHIITITIAICIPNPFQRCTTSFHIQNSCSWYPPNYHPEPIQFATFEITTSSLAQLYPTLPQVFPTSFIPVLPKFTCLAGSEHQTKYPISGM